MLAAGNVQEVMDLGAVAHLSTIKGRVPFIHFFDGFRTSHEVQKIEAWDYETLGEMLDWESVERFRKHALNPEHPVLRGTAQNPDIFFQAREACNPFYNNLPAIVEEYMGKVNAATGKDYQLFNYYGAPDAEKVIIAMGSVCDTIEETIDYMLARGDKVGLLKVRLYRPFVTEKFISALPKTVKKIAVLDRTKEPGALGEPLFLDVVSAIKDTEFGNVKVVGGRYGLGSKDVPPACIFAVYNNLSADEPKNGFTVGIEDDVTHLSLPLTESHNTTPEGTFSLKFWGLGADGTVGANKNSIKIIGDHTDMNVQAYFYYDSKKSGGVTISQLRFGAKPIKSTYFVTKADFVACHNASYVDKYEMVQDIKEGGTFLLNCAWDVKELSERLPVSTKQYIAKNKINFYTIDGIAIAHELGLGGRINTILQAAFFKLSNIIPIQDAVKFMKDAATASYGKKGEKIVAMNHAAIDKGIDGAVKVEVPADWTNAQDTAPAHEVQGDRKELVDFVKNILIPVNRQLGDNLPVSTFVGAEDGTFPQGSAAYEKRGIAVEVPEWIPENCIQCNQCSYVCPHAVIRPFALDEKEMANAPAAIKSKQMIGKGLENYKFNMSISTLDCTGCSNCANICPAKNKALVMKPIDDEMPQQEVFNYTTKNVSDKPEIYNSFKLESVKGSQFKQPLLEFSGACAGCGEPAYAKLATQLFGDRMYIANATGCSSIWGGSAPSTPYTVGKRGFGPAWSNSLFEDNAEYGYGMYLATTQLRLKMASYVDALVATGITGEVKDAIDGWISTMFDGKLNRDASDKLISALTNAKLSGEQADIAKKILDDKEFLAKKSQWILGGDGWAYDIGFGGLDHVIASGEDVNILVFDTEVYSNTGGQSSKSTPVGAVAQFAAAGKSVKKKDLAGIAMSYGYVYVAQIAMGADYNQCVKAFAEAESYKGPSIIIAYAPCINHGIKSGMSNAQAEIKAAVAAGYWHMFRFDPRLVEEGKNPFQLDSKAPTASYRDFILNEVRYSSLTRSFPERAETLFDAAEKNAKDKYEHLLRLTKLYE